MIAFATSGLLHEWTVYLGIKYDRNDVEGSYYNPSKIVMGRHLLFFCYGFIPVTAEKLLGKIGLLECIWRWTPRIMKTWLVLMTSLPLAFWFIDPYLHGRLFLDYEGLGLTIVKIK